MLAVREPGLVILGPGLTVHILISGPAITIRATPEIVATVTLFNDMTQGLTALRTSILAIHIFYVHLPGLAVSVFIGGLAAAIRATPEVVATISLFDDMP
jgi:ABC-type arginine transport system permease subunit